MSNEIPTPWSNRTRQEDGRVSERKVARDLGARVHPNSGAGRIKFDASNETELFEMKDAGKSHVVNAELLQKLFTTAVRQGKEPFYVITFANGIRLVGHIEK